MSDPNFSPEPKSAVPSHLLNGSLPLHQVGRGKGRQTLASSIQSSYERDTDPGRDDDLTDAFVNDRRRPLVSSQDNAPASKETPPVSLKEAPRDPRDETLLRSPPPSSSRPASPYTLNPPIDFDGLSWPSVGTRARLEASPEEAEERLNKLAGAVRTIFECIGEDPEREGLRSTPKRYAQALMYFTKGYEENVRDLVNGAVFHEDHDEMVIVKDIEVFSLCEHHMVPFTGKMHIGYIPDRRVLGLSKLARLAEMFSRRLQVQERLTKQVALAIAEVLKPRGVAVVMDSSHLCMVMRGVQKTTSTTTTSCMLGCMRSSDKTRKEFLSLLSRRRINTFNLEMAMNGNGNGNGDKRSAAENPYSLFSASTTSSNEIASTSNSQRRTTSTKADKPSQSPYSEDSRPTVPTKTADPGLEDLTDDSLRSRHRPEKRHGIVTDTPVELRLGLPGHRSMHVKQANSFVPHLQTSGLQNQSASRPNSAPVGNSRLGTLGGAQIFADARDLSQHPSLLRQPANPYVAGPGVSAEQLERTAQRQSHAKEVPSLGQASQIPIRTSPTKTSKRKASEVLHRPTVSTAAGNRNSGLQAEHREHIGFSESSRMAPNQRQKLVSAVPQAYRDVPKSGQEVQFPDHNPQIDINADIFASLDNDPTQNLPRPVRKPSREKFSSILLPPPAFVYVRTNDPNFNIFSDGFLRFSDLCFLLANALPLRDLLSLYSISKDFHSIVNQRLTTMIFDQARAICYDAACAFPWRCYHKFTRPDPINRIPHPVADKARQGIPRDVPSFQWVFFCLFRQKVVQEIMAIMAEDGVPLPDGCKKAIMRVWFLMDLPENSRRIAIIHNSSWFTDETLYYAMMFFVKMDMRFNDPFSTRYVQGTKHMLLAQPSLSTFWKVLKGQALKTEFEVLKMWICWKYVPQNIEESRLELFDIPPQEVGRVQFEHWGQKIARDSKTGKLLKPIKLLRPDELIPREMIRRNITCGPRHWMRIFMWGYVDPETLEDYKPRHRERRIDLRDEYADDDVVSGAAVGNDELLDLGDSGRKISTQVRPHEETVEDVKKDQAEDEFLEAIQHISAHEKMDRDIEEMMKSGRLPTNIQYEDWMQWRERWDGEDEWDDDEGVDGSEDEDEDEDADEYDSEDEGDFEYESESGDDIEDDDNDEANVDGDATKAETNAEGRQDNAMRS